MLLISVTFPERVVYHSLSLNDHKRNIVMSRDSTRPEARTSRYGDTMRVLYDHS